MEKLRIISELNRKEIMREEITDKEKSETIQILLNGINNLEEIQAYKKRMRTNENTVDQYPNYYIPPCDGKQKHRLVQGYLPKTNILYANHYELEILRLLIMYSTDNKAKEMVSDTIRRLQHTCFGNSCTKGECLATGISVLRFLILAKPTDEVWINKILNPLGNEFMNFGSGQAAKQNGIPLSYLLMVFTDINSWSTRQWIEQKKDWLLDLLRRGWITGKLSNGKISEGDTYNLMGKYIIRNALGTLPEYKDIVEHRIYINEEDNRCYCDI